MPPPLQGRNPLSTDLSGDQHGCPIPSAHDKLSEAHYFIHEMIQHYHDCDRFRYSLSAFLQAARTTTLVLQKELADKDGFAGWYKPWQDKMAADPDLKLLNSERVRVVHKEALVPASSMFFGAFEFGRQKFGFAGLPLDPMWDSVPALIELQRFGRHVEEAPPHRGVRVLRAMMSEAHTAAAMHVNIIAEPPGQGEIERPFDALQLRWTPPKAARGRKSDTSARTCHQASESRRTHGTPRPGLELRL